MYRISCVCAYNTKLKYTDKHKYSFFAGRELLFFVVKIAVYILGVRAKNLKKG